MTRLSVGPTLLVCRLAMKASSEWYSKVTPTVDEGRYRKPFLWKSLCELLQPASKVLDVGCGTGVDMLALEKLCGFESFGFDLSRSSLLSARDKGLKVVFADWSRDWPFRSAFDLVMMNFVVHLANDFQALLAAASRHIGVAGYLSLLTASEDDIRRRFLNNYFKSLSENDLTRYPALTDIVACLKSIGLVEYSVIPISLGFDSITRDFLKVVRNRRWSSLQALPDEEFNLGVRQLNRDVEKWNQSGCFPCWENRKSLIVASRLA